MRTAKNLFQDQLFNSQLSGKGNLWAAVILRFIQHVKWTKCSPPSQKYCCSQLNISVQRPGTVKNSKSLWSTWGTLGPGAARATAEGAAGREVRSRHASAAGFRRVPLEGATPRSAAHTGWCSRLRFPWGAGPEHEPSHPASYKRDEALHTQHDSRAAATAGFSSAQRTKYLETEQSCCCSRLNSEIHPSGWCSQMAEGNGRKSNVCCQDNVNMYKSKALWQVI